MKPASILQEWVAHTSSGRQVRPDQTEAVKGQNGKTLVTAGTIKRLLLCPVKGIEKQSIFTEWKEKQSKKKRKKDKKENREEKKGN